MGWLRSDPRTFDDAWMISRLAGAGRRLPGITGLLAEGRIGLAQAGAACWQVSHLPDLPQQPGEAQASPDDDGGPESAGRGAGGGREDRGGACHDRPDTGADETPGGDGCGAGGGSAGRGSASGGGADPEGDVWAGLWRLGDVHAAADELFSRFLPGMDPAGVRALGAHLREAADARERAAGDYDEYQQRKLRISRSLGGTAEISGRLHPAAAEQVIAAFEDLGGKAGPADTRTKAQRWADVFTGLPGLTPDTPAPASAAPSVPAPAATPSSAPAPSAGSPSAAGASSSGDPGPDAPDAGREGARGPGPAGPGPAGPRDGLGSGGPAVGDGDPDDSQYPGGAQYDGQSSPDDEPDDDRPYADAGHHHHDGSHGGSGSDSGSDSHSVDSSPGGAPWPAARDSEPADGQTGRAGKGGPRAGEPGRGEPGRGHGQHAPPGVAPAAFSRARTRVLVTIPISTLLGWPMSPGAVLGSGIPVTGETARRLACDAETVRIITGPAGLAQQSVPAWPVPGQPVPGQHGPPWSARNGHSGQPSQDPGGPDRRARDGCTQDGCTGGGDGDGDLCGTDEPPPLLDATGQLTRMLAAAIAQLPGPLGRPSAVLDVGRKDPGWTPRQRDALYARYGGRCCRQRCSARATVIHHVIFWADGGTTCVTNGAPVCEYCHWLVHEGGWRLSKDPDGQITLHPPSPGWRPGTIYRHGKPVKEGTA